MNKRIRGWAFACCLLFTGHVSAAVFDFPALIDGSSGQISGILSNGSAFGPANPGELAFKTFDWTEGGITLTASANNGGPAYAYLDRGNAGLGVCRIATSANQCNPGSDDNVTVGEVLKMSFDQAVVIDLAKSVFRKENHGLYNPVPDGIQVRIDSGSWVQLNTLSTLTGQLFEMRTLTDKNQFYVSVMDVTAVPEPSTWLLFGLGLLGFSMVARRRQRS